MKGELSPAQRNKSMLSSLENTAEGAKEKLTNDNSQLLVTT